MDTLYKISVSALVLFAGVAGFGSLDLESLSSTSLQGTFDGRPFDVFNLDMRFDDFSSNPQDWSDSKIDSMVAHELNSELANICYGIQLMRELREPLKKIKQIHGSSIEKWFPLLEKAVVKHSESALSTEEWLQTLWLLREIKRLGYTNGEIEFYIEQGASDVAKDLMELHEDINNQRIKFNLQVESEQEKGVDIDDYEFTVIIALNRPSIGTLDAFLNNIKYYSAEFHQENVDRELVEILEQGLYFVTFTFPYSKYVVNEAGMDVYVMNNVYNFLDDHSEYAIETFLKIISSRIMDYTSTRIGERSKNENRLKYKVHFDFYEVLRQNTSYIQQLAYSDVLVGKDKLIKSMCNALLNSYYLTPTWESYHEMVQNPTDTFSQLRVLNTQRILYRIGKKYQFDDALLMVDILEETNKTVDVNFPILKDIQTTIRAITDNHFSSNQGSILSISLLVPFDSNGKITIRDRKDEGFGEIFECASDDEKVMWEYRTEDDNMLYLTYHVNAPGPGEEITGSIEVDILSTTNLEKEELYDIAYYLFMPTKEFIAKGEIKQGHYKMVMADSESQLKE